MSGRDGAVLGFIEEVEGLLLAAGLGKRRPELMALLPLCEKEWLSKNWNEGALDTLWDKAQRLRVMFGGNEAIDDKRACMGGGVLGCDGCRNATEEQLERLERISWNNRFANYNKWHRRYPYGVWTCADGRQVLFNRNYNPILVRYVGGSVVDGDPEEWVDWVSQAWFYGGSDNPRGCEEVQGRLREVIRVFYAGGDVEKEFAVDSTRKMKVVK
jgi:hypothetical protein